MVKQIVAATGIKIDIEDDGKIHISSSDQKAADEAIRMINEITAEAAGMKTWSGKLLLFQATPLFKTSSFERPCSNTKSSLTKSRLWS